MRRNDNLSIDYVLNVGMKMGIPPDSPGWTLSEFLCNLLNLDPRLTLGELREMVGERSWESTHEERMLSLEVEAFLAIEDLKRTDPESPFITGRPRGWFRRGSDRGEPS